MRIVVTIFTILLFFPFGIFKGNITSRAPSSIESDNLCLSSLSIILSEAELKKARSISKKSLIEKGLVNESMLDEIYETKIFKNRIFEKESEEVHEKAALALALIQKNNPTFGPGKVMKKYKFLMSFCGI